jgi:tetratricopeptide (TPR) repeat protein
MKRLVVAITAFGMVLTAASGLMAATKEQKAASNKAIADAERAIQDGDKPAALEAYKVFMKNTPEDERAPWVLIQMGDIYAEGGNTKEAFASYTRVLREYPDAMDARVARSRLNEVSASALDIARNRVAGAVSENERMQAMADMAVIYEWLDSPKDAVAIYRDMSKTASSDEWKKKSAAKMEGLVDAAIAAVKQGPPVPNEEKWVAVAELAEAAESWDKASEWYLKLAEVSKETGKKLKYQLAAANAHQLGNNPERARQICMGIVATGVKGADAIGAYQCAGQALEALRKFNDAIKIYDSYFKIAAGADTGWCYLRKAACYEKLGALDTAIKTYRDLVETNPDHYAAPEAFIGMGKIFESRKEFTAARAAYERVVNEYPKSHKVGEAKGLIQALVIKEQEWEMTKQELNKIADKYQKRERKQ